MWDLTLLGSFRLLREGNIVRGLKEEKLQSLLAFLSLRPGNPQSRGRMASLLWPNSSESQSRTNLRKALHTLHEYLPELADLLVLEGKTLAFAPDKANSVDVIRFRTAAQTNTLRSLRQAAKLYGGDFLPGLWDEWILAERELLNEEYLRVLEKIAELLENRGDLDEAIFYTRTLLAKDQLREKFWQRLIRLNGLTGDGAAVETTWKQCTKTIKRELGIEPSFITQQVYEESRLAVHGRIGSENYIIPPLRTVSNNSKTMKFPNRRYSETMLGYRDKDIFVGRKEELDFFRKWLLSENSTVLNIYGPGGVGKTTLLRAFEKIARGENWSVVQMEGSEFTDVSGKDIWLNRTGSVIFLDAFDEISNPFRWIQDKFLENLAVPFHIVIAGRHPLKTMLPLNSGWHRLLFSLPLTGFSTEVSWEYCKARGLKDSVISSRLIRAAAGSPLALSLAVDMVIQYGWDVPQSDGFTKNITQIPTWHVVVRSLVEELLRETDDPVLLRSLEAAAVVHQFDRDLLTALLGQEGKTLNLAGAFDKLASLSVVRPTAHGLSLHDEVRRLISDDLRWRSPRSYTELLLRAITYYRQLIYSGEPLERERLVAECLFLVNEGLLNSLFFEEKAAEQIYVTNGEPEDIQAAHDVWLRWYQRSLGEYPSPALELQLRRTLAHPSVRFRLARSYNREILGFAAVIPICRDCLDLLTFGSATASLVDTCFTSNDLDSLPLEAHETTLFHFRYVVEGDQWSETVRSLLLCDLIGLLINEGTYFVSTPFAYYKEVLDVLGFQRLDSARNWGNGNASPVEHYKLDLSRTGFDEWYKDLLHRWNAFETLPTV
ncbi:MAG: hypothetical protein M1483_04595 [Actinobacteria bacterium]|nr:hypothetical protein [Actinomycetota bacterium]MCL6104891.1 hypothetical protein [Actinomycetota bacterium]